MDPNEIEKMNRFEEIHWWFQGKKFLIESIINTIDILPGKFMDIGCGTGMFLNIIGRNRNAYGIDISEQALSYCKNKGNRFLVRSSGDYLPFKENVFSLVLLLDMLEHVENAHEVLKEVHRICKPKSVVLITVPAFDFLWGTHDISHHHKRRYTHSKLRDLGLSAGFLIERLTYTNFFIFIPVLLRRIISRKLSANKESDLRETPVIINSFLKCIYKFEAFYLKKANFLFGVSLLMVLKKPD